MRFWRIASDWPGRYSADDLTGGGARRAGARWNAKGVPAVYASYHLATAVLESLAHIGNRRQPVVRYVVAIDVDDAVFSKARTGVVEYTVDDLPVGWDVTPPVSASQLFGAAQFKRDRLGFAVPSILVHEEMNLVLNPLHSLFKKAVKSRIERAFFFDSRL